MSKYAPLAAHLKESECDSVAMSFEEVEAVIGAPLPPSAYDESLPWWSNDKTHIQASSWMNAGWRKSDVDVRQETVVFCRHGVPLTSVAGCPDRDANAPSKNGL